jgi:hypothetical protein
VCSLTALFIAFFPLIGRVFPDCFLLLKWTCFSLLSYLIGMFPYPSPVLGVFYYCFPLLELACPLTTSFPFTRHASLTASFTASFTAYSTASFILISRVSLLLLTYINSFPYWLLFLKSCAFLYWSSLFYYSLPALNWARFSYYLLYYFLYGLLHCLLYRFLYCLLDCFLYCLPYLKRACSITASFTASLPLIGHVSPDCFLTLKLPCFLPCSLPCSFTSHRFSPY